MSSQTNQPSFDGMIDTMRKIIREELKLALEEKKTQRDVRSSKRTSAGKAIEANVVPPRRRFSNFDKPLSEMFKKLEKQGLLKPTTAKTQPNPNAPNYIPNVYCELHQVNGHHTDNCMKLKHEIQDLIDEGKIPDPEEEALTSFEEGKPKMDLLGQPSGKFDYKVYYSKPIHADQPLSSIVPTGWGSDFEEEDKKTEYMGKHLKEVKKELERTPKQSRAPRCGWCHDPKTREVRMIASKQHRQWGQTGGGFGPARN